MPPDPQLHDGVEKATAVARVPLRRQRLKKLTGSWVIVTHPSHPRKGMEISK